MQHTRMPTTPTTQDMHVFPQEVERAGSIYVVHFITINDEPPPRALKGLWYPGPKVFIPDIERICRMRLPYRLLRGTMVHWKDDQ